MNNEINTSLSLIGLKSISTKVLLATVNNGPSTVAEISSILSIPKSSIYDAYKELLSMGLVIEIYNEKGKMFETPDNEQLKAVLNKRLDVIKDAQNNLLTFISTNKKNKQVTRPKIRFYSGTYGIQQAFRDMPWTKADKQAYLMWPMKDMIDTVGESFLKFHSEQRYKYNVTINAIQPASDKKLQTKDHTWLDDKQKDKLRNIKYINNKDKWLMSYWIYGDKCLFASGGSEKFAFIIQSKEFSQLMKLLWNQTWVNN